MMNNLSQRLNDDIAQIDSELNRVITALSERNGFGAGYYRDLFRFAGRSAAAKPLVDAMNYSLTGGGKRIRPVLTLEFCRLFGGDETAALKMGAALEMVHTYSLIHDDLPCMDNDDYRRGKPTNHKVYGEATAVLAGDGLLTEAFSLLSNGSISGCEKRYLTAIGILAESAGALGMAGGQQMDLAGEAKPLTREEHLEMTLRKTGELIRAACLLGCASADADTEKRAAAEKYAYGVGLSFQIIDDILDIGTEDEKTTFLTFCTEEEARTLARELTDSAINAVREYAGSDFLIALAEALYSRKI